MALDPKRHPRNPPLKAKPRPAKDPEQILFTRDGGKRVPRAVKEASDLWLELFMDIYPVIAPDRPDGPFNPDLTNKKTWLETAAVCADMALELYEDRWPHAGRKDPLD